jgi:hypothetical protein
VAAADGVHTDGCGPAAASFSVEWAAQEGRFAMGRESIDSEASLARLVQRLLIDAQQSLLERHAIHSVLDARHREISDRIEQLSNVLNQPEHRSADELRVLGEELTEYHDELARVSAQRRGHTERVARLFRIIRSANAVHDQLSTRCEWSVLCDAVDSILQAERSLAILRAEHHLGHRIEDWAQLVSIAQAVKSESDQLKVTPATPAPQK